MSNGNPVPYTTTLRVRDTCLCLHLQRAARAVARRFDAALRPLGLTNGQFSLLMALNRPEPASMGAIAALLAMDRTTLTANLKPLVRRGMAAVTIGEADRRSRRLVLTPVGHALLTAALPLWEDTRAQIEAHLPARASEELRQDLAALAVCDQSSPPAAAMLASVGSR